LERAENAGVFEFKPPQTTEQRKEEEKGERAQRSGAQATRALSPSCATARARSGALPLTNALHARIPARAPLCARRA